MDCTCVTWPACIASREAAVSVHSSEHTQQLRLLLVLRVSARLYCRTVSSSVLSA
jgi:hypothetical protein